MRDPKILIMEMIVDAGRSDTFYVDRPLFDAVLRAYALSPRACGAIQIGKTVVRPHDVIDPE